MGESALSQRKGFPAAFGLHPNANAAAIGAAHAIANAIANIMANAIANAS